MATTEELSYLINSQAQLNAFQQAIDAVGDMAKANEKMAEETDENAKSVNNLNKRLKEVIGTGKELKPALSNVGNVAGKIGLGVGTIVGAIGSVMVATQEWQLGVERLSDQFSIGLDEASALAASWERAGMNAEQGAAIFSSLQGRLIGELEARKEAEKELAKLGQDRLDLIEEMGEAETDFQRTIADLEAQRADINDSNISERKAAADRELAELEDDYKMFVKRQEDLEREQTDNFEKIWEERARKFVEASEKLRDKFSTDARKARNVREFREVASNFEQQRQLLVDNLNRENQEQSNSNEKTVRDREAANEREKVLMEEKSAEIKASAERDTQAMEEANQKALVDLDARIASEKEAYADRSEDFNERMSEIAAAEEEAANRGGDLAFAMNELGVEIFDADGKMRPFKDIIWDTQEALQNMEEGGRKAALIADLGLEDAAPWINRGMREIDSLQFVQDKNLQVTEDSLEAIHKQRQALHDARLGALGFANSLNITEKANEAVVAGMTHTQTAIVIARGLWDQLKTIVGLAWGKVIEAIQIAKGLWDQFVQIVALGVPKIGESIKGMFGFGEGGMFEGLFGGGGNDQVDIGSDEALRQQMGRLELGTDQLRDTADLVFGGGGNGGGATININAPVFGVDDLDNKIKSAVDRYDQGAFATP